MQPLLLAVAGGAFPSLEGGPDGRDLHRDPAHRSRIHFLLAHRVVEVALPTVTLISAGGVFSGWRYCVVFPTFELECELWELAVVLAPWVWMASGEALTSGWASAADPHP